MQNVKIKVKHQRFLNINDFEKLKNHGINARLNNPVYGEYTAHMMTESEMSDEQLEKIKQNFHVVLFEEKEGHIYVQIDLQK